MDLDYAIEIRELALDCVIAGKHFGHCSYNTGLTKDIPQPGHQPLCCSTVDLRIDTVDVTRGSLRPVASALKNEGSVFTLRNMRTVKCETQLDWHVESWNPAGRLNTGQVVDGKIRSERKIGMLAKMKSAGGPASGLLLLFAISRNATSEALPR